MKSDGVGLGCVERGDRYGAAKPLSIYLPSGKFDMALCERSIFAFGDRYVRVKDEESISVADEESIRLLTNARARCIILCWIIIYKYFGIYTERMLEYEGKN